jgi:hypothetical protein
LKRTFYRFGKTAALCSARGSRRRAAPGEMPTKRLNARLNAASDS